MDLPRSNDYSLTFTTCPKTEAAVFQHALCTFFAPQNSLCGAPCAPRPLRKQATKCVESSRHHNKMVCRDSTVRTTGKNMRGSDPTNKDFKNRQCRTNFIHIYGNGLAVLELGVVKNLPRKRKSQRNARCGQHKENASLESFDKKTVSR